MNITQNSPLSKLQVSNSLQLQHPAAKIMTWSLEDPIKKCFPKETRIIMQSYKLPPMNDVRSKVAVVKIYCPAIYHTARFIAKRIVTRITSV